MKCELLKGTLGFEDLSLTLMTINKYSDCFVRYYHYDSKGVLILQSEDIKNYLRDSKTKIFVCPCLLSIIK